MFKSQIPSLHGICMQREKQYKVDLFSVINLRRFSICENRRSKYRESMQLSLPTTPLPFGLSTTHPKTPCLQTLSKKLRKRKIFSYFHFVSEEESLRAVQAMRSKRTKHLHPGDLLLSVRLKSYKAEPALLTICLKVK